MYEPPHFKEERTEVLHEAIRQVRLATLVTLTPAGLEATHLPMLVDAASAPYGKLVGHVARANPQWKTSSAEVEGLAMFLGPQAYITPSWYATKRETGKVVPTWNYVAIHAYGTLRFIEDADELLGVVTRLTDTHEKTRAAPWAVSDAPPDFVRAQLKGIVGVEMTITRLQGKWKMSQNRPPADRQGVAEGLRQDGETAAAGLVPVPGE
ncbi:MAG: FMN-binding negative transcriptional regulator [Rhodospirillales bacterium]|nr:FMN-binding negative transcriptional regulator [Rhodospirillales bacterium]